MNIKETILEVIYAILPIAFIVMVFQFTITPFPAEIFAKFIAGIVMVMLGLFLFLLGVNVGLLQVGEIIGSVLTTKGKLWMMLLFGLILGVVVTIAEPGVQVLAIQVDGVSDGAIAKNLLMIVVALGVGIFLALALLRIVFNLSLVYLLLAGYALIFFMASFAAPQFVPVAFDAGGVTTGPMTVPFILSLGVGVTSVIRKRQTANDSFGLVALASIGPVLAVLIIGVIVR